jgi:raffinose/stachyose/melibiose transport system permease protein
MAAMIIIPLYVSVMGGFKHTGELRTNSLGLPKDWKFENYTSLLGNTDFWLFLWNSTVYAVGTTFFVVYLLL